MPKPWAVSVSSRPTLVIHLQGTSFPHRPLNKHLMVFKIKSRLVPPTSQLALTSPICHHPHSFLFLKKRLVLKPFFLFSIHLLKPNLAISGHRRFCFQHYSQLLSYVSATDLRFFGSFILKKFNCTVLLHVNRTLGLNSSVLFLPTSPFISL